MAENELVISTVPNRTGLYLCKQEGTTVRPIARFTRGGESAEEFMDWARATGVVTVDERKGGRT